jgi:hypothetical protein
MSPYEEGHLYCLVITVPDYRFRGPGLVSRCYHIFRKAVGLVQDPLSLVRIIEKLLERSSGRGLETGPKDPLR